MKKFFGMLLGAMIILGLPAHADKMKKTATDYEKTATPEDSVLVYGIVVLPFASTPTSVLYTSPDTSKPNAPVTHFADYTLHFDKKYNIGYFLFTGVVPKDTPYQYVEWNLYSPFKPGITLGNKRVECYYTYGRNNFNKSNADFKSQKQPGVQDLGVFYLSTSDVNVNDFTQEGDMDKVRKWIPQSLTKVYKGTVWEPVIKQAMEENSKK